MIGKKFARVKVGKTAWAIIDEEDLELASRYKWHVNRTRHLRYAQTIVNGKFYKMHRVMLGIAGPQYAQVYVDHINGDGLDNRRCNLRTCKQGENSKNLHRAWGASQCRGVFQQESRDKWRARIKVDYKDIEIGSFDTKADAVRAYAFASRVLHGEFGNPVALLNASSISESAGESPA